MDALLTVLCIGLTWSWGVTAPTSTPVDLLMPNVQPQEPDTYLCRSMDVSQMKPYITGFTPNANMDIAHHILLYSCSEAGSDKPVWDCGEMATTKSDYSKGKVCASGANIMYAWAMDAPSLKLPPDVAFKVGGDTGINKVVMQVHYKNVSTFLPPENKKDSSGLTLSTTNEPRAKRAGVYLMVTGGVIPAHSVEFLEAACSFREAGVEMHPFAYRTHTHKLGRVVSGYRVRDGRWTEIGRQDPRKPEMFYNATTPGLTVKKGDILAARCTMENTLDHSVYIGNTQNDEMCNFYIMYYMDEDQRLLNNACFRQGGPGWYLRDFLDQDALNLNAMPNSASTLPGSNTTWHATTQAIQDLPSAGHTDLSEGGLQDEEQEEEEEEEDNPEVDELLDDFISNMDPREVEALVSQMLSEENAPSYLGMQPVPQRRLNDVYDGYYNPEATQKLAPARLDAW